MTQTEQISRIADGIIGMAIEFEPHPDDVAKIYSTMMLIDAEIMRRIVEIRRAERGR